MPSQLTFEEVQENWWEEVVMSPLLLVEEGY